MSRRFIAYAPSQKLIAVCIVYSCCTYHGIYPNCCFSLHAPRCRCPSRYRSSEDASRLLPRAHQGAAVVMALSALARRMERSSR